MNFAALLTAPRLALAALSLAAAAPVTAQDDGAAVEAVEDDRGHGTIGTDLANALVCAAVLNRLGGDDNRARAEALLEKARKWGAEIAYDATQIMSAYDEWVEIVNAATAEEMPGFIKICQDVGHVPESTRWTPRG